ncbi:MAG: SGNH/GDSL hydrolase family protein [Clostridia bacterium]|nr:SGNH/GDSL hydrolase family protein [Clostridia bacterium]
MKLQGLKINFLGDSITEGCGASETRFRFTDRIAADYGAICRNYGIGGARIAKQTKLVPWETVDNYYSGRVETMDANADLVVIFGGTNDFGHGDAPLGQMSDRTPDTFYGGLHTLCQNVLKRFPKATVVFLTPLHRWNEENPCGDGKEQPVAVLKTYVEIIKEVAEYYALPVLDLFAESGIQPQVDFLKERYTVDGLHPNDLGYALLSRKIAAFIEKL